MMPISVQRFVAGERWTKTSRRLCSWTIRKQLSNKHSAGTAWVKTGKNLGLGFSSRPTARAECVPRSTSTKAQGVLPRISGLLMRLELQTGRSDNSPAFLGELLPLTHPSLLSLLNDAYGWSAVTRVMALFWTLLPAPVRPLMLFLISIRPMAPIYVSPSLKWTTMQIA